MSRQITISGTTYNVPSNNESSPWGEDLSDYLVALGNATNTFTVSGDISLSSATLANNQSSAANVTGLSFSTLSVRAASIQYSLLRGSSAETGQIIASYDGTSWTMARNSNGDVGVTFTVTAAGQFQYTSTNTGSAITMKFRARVTSI